ncbi:MAG TPA: alpha/beta hydrolase [Candidatus Eremiobacteraceae bacterium]|nr:alpha/beta hydrolase [Candidatus Eremiobacteraceae bacterium]
MRYNLADWSWITTILLAAVAVTASAQTPTARIDQTSFVPLGGLEQWISIRGDDRSNPVLLVVHGGPGEVQWPQAEVYKPWEKTFTVVQWDQRGAGHTFGRYGTNTPDVTLDRISKDGVELAEYLCRQLGKKKIIVLGHSWGSIVATRMVQIRPNLFAAYVGTGQVTSWAAMVNTQYDLVLAKARKDGDQATIKELEANRPDPANAQQYFSFSSKYHVRSLWPPPDQAWLQHLRSRLPELQASNPEQSKYLEEGMEFQGEHVLPDQLATNLPKTACEIDTAYFVIQGQDDIVTPTQAANDYFKCVKAPKKELILIPNAGHFAFMTAASEFLELLKSKVRPVAIARGG